MKMIDMYKRDFKDGFIESSFILSDIQDLKNGVDTKPISRHLADRIEVFFVSTLGLIETLDLDNSEINKAFEVIKAIESLTREDTKMINEESIEDIKYSMNQTKDTLKQYEEDLKRRSKNIRNLKKIITLTCYTKKHSLY